MPCGAIWALFVFACRGRRPDGPNLGLHKFSYYPYGGLPSARRVDLHRTSCKKNCHCEPVTDVTGVAIRNPLRRTFCTRKCLRRSTSCQQRQKAPKERRQNPWFRNPFRG